MESEFDLNFCLCNLTYSHIKERICPSIVIYGRPWKVNLPIKYGTWFSSWSKYFFTKVATEYKIFLWTKKLNICGCTLYKQGFLDVVHGHGRMMDPPSRNAMWRFGYPNPVNYNDNEVFCGGFGVQARIYAAVNSCDTVPTGYSKTVLQLDCHIIQ